MKRILQLMILMMGSYAFSQVGAGTPVPNESTQLEIAPSDKSQLVPRLVLTSLTGFSIVTNTSVESITVFNVSTTAEHTPVCYNDSKWSRVLNGTNYSNVHPVLESYGKRLYFSLNIASALGQTNLLDVTIKNRRHYV